MPLSLQQRISKLWAASFNLETAAKRAVEHLPPDKAKDLQREIDSFRRTVDHIRKAP